MAFLFGSAVKTKPNYDHISCFGVCLMDLWASYGWLFTTLEGWAILFGSCVFIVLVKYLATRFITEKPETNPTNFLDLAFLTKVPAAAGAGAEHASCRALRGIMRRPRRKSGA